MDRTTARNLNHIDFEGTTPARARRFSGLGANCATLPAPPAEVSSDDFLRWVLRRAGLDAAAYRAEPLRRRLPACRRVLKVHSVGAARELLEHQPELISTAIGSLLIGVTDFFREPAVFDMLAAQVLPRLAGRKGPVRIWSAACSTGAELYSVAILLAEGGLLERTYLLGTDCRDEAIEQARLGSYDAKSLEAIPSTTRDKYFEPDGRRRKLINALRRRAHWKTADLLAGVEMGPWDIILWRNGAIYLEAHAAEAIWRQLASVLASDGVVIVGKAERPPRDAGLIQMGRCVYCREPAIANPSQSGDRPSIRGRIDRQ
jgi:chemotaxis protein methyltransferase CheR